MFEADCFLGAADHFRYGEGQFVDQIGPFYGWLRQSRTTEISKRAATAAEGEAYSPLFLTAESKLSKYITEIEITKNIFLGIPLLKSGRAEGIVLGPLFLITQDGIRFTDLFKFFFAGFVTFGMIRMIFHRQFAIRFFNFFISGLFIDP